MIIHYDYVTPLMIQSSCSCLLVVANFSVNLRHLTAAVGHNPLGALCYVQCERWIDLYSVSTEAKCYSHVERVIKMCNVT